MRRPTCWLLVMIAVLLLGACSSGASSTRSVAGTYTKSVTEDQLVASGASVANSLVLAGEWRMELSSDGVVHLWRSLESGSLYDALEGTFQVSQNSLIFGSDRGNYSCAAGGFDQGSYRWTLVGDSLTLTAVEDECPRKYVMTTGPWTKEGD